MACEFCESYAASKKINDEINEQNIIEVKLKVALMAEHYRDGYRVGRYTDKPVELTFCPVCGKRLIHDEHIEERNYGYVLFHDGHKENIVSHHIDTDRSIRIRTENGCLYVYSECLVDISGYKVKHHVFAKYDDDRDMFIGVFDIDKFVLKWDVTED